jgi:hypothetical protein
MPIQRRPYTVLALWTAVAVIPMIVLNGAMTVPVVPGCFEYCDLGQTLAAWAFRLVAVVWLVGTIVVASLWSRREPTIAVVFALAAAVALGFVTLGVYGTAPLDEAARTHLYVAWVISLGLQLPPTWRLADRSPRSLPLRVVVWVMTIAVALAALAIVLLGTDLLRVGPTIVVVAWWAFMTGLLIVAAAAWRDRVLAPSVAAPLITASLPILLVPIGIVWPGRIAYVIFLALPLTGIAWAWLALAWVRGGRSPRVTEVLR